MKTQGIILVLGLAAAVSTTAFGQQQTEQSNAATASAAIVQKQKWQVFTPFNQTQSSEQNKIERAGGLSSQPWTEIVGWHSGMSEFPSAETHESKLYLISISAEPPR